MTWGEAVSRSGVGLLVIAAILAGCSGTATPAPNPGATVPIDEMDCAALVAVYEAEVADLVEGLGAGTVEGYEYQVIAFLRDTSDPDLVDVAGDVEGWTGVEEVGLVDVEQALDEFRLLFADQPDLIAAVEADPGILPPSIRVSVGPDSYEETAERLASLPGVFQVESPAIERLADALARHAAEAAGRWPAFTAIARQGSLIGCPVDDIGGQADLTGVEAGGASGEWIVFAAVRGIG